MNIVFIHGIADQENGYSRELFFRIVKGCPDKQLKHNEFYWAHFTTNLISDYEQYQHRKAGRRGIKGFFGRGGKYTHLIQKVDPLAIQVMHYIYNKENKGATILKKIQNQFTDLEGPTVVLAHSLGSVIAYDYLFEFKGMQINPKITIEAFITFGSPIPLFISAMGYPHGGLRMSHKVKKWVNIIDPDDVIARYCQPHFTHLDVEDRRINIGFTPLGTHGKYWKHKKMAKEVCSIINAISESPAA
jgi:hypothetical protein